MFRFLKFIVLLATCLELVKGEFLRVTGKDLYYGTDRVFLSGSNIAWSCYGCDFGNNRYEWGSGEVLEGYINRIQAAGGNSIRIWIHVEGETTPQFDDNGYVLGPDEANTLISDLGRFLDYCAARDVFVIPVLWNGAVMRQQKMIDLMWDDSKLETYLEKALRPMVQALSTKPALAAWEIMNEPEGSIKTEAHENPCYDTSVLTGSGAGWTGVAIPMENMSKFIAKQVAVIHQADPKVLVTLGSWSERPQSDAFGETYNYYKDSCMVQAGGSDDSKLDFYQIHSYSWQGLWSEHSPFKIHADAFQLDKPLVIGEFASACASGETIEQLFDHAYNNGYQGAWSWQYNAGGDCSDSQDTQDRGTNHIRSYNQNGLVDIDIR